MGNGNSCFKEECPMCKQEIDRKACMNPYIWFYLDVYKELAPKAVKEIGIEAGRRWRTMTDEEKEPYIRIAKHKRKVQGLKSKNQPKNLKSQTTECDRPVQIKKRKLSKRERTKLTFN